MSGMADVVVVNGIVHTMVRPGDTSDAVAVRDGGIVALGDQARDLIGPGTTVIDARGGAVTPGLVDSHTHPVWAFDIDRGVDLSAAKDIDQLRSFLRDAAARTPDGEWVVGHALNYEPLTGGPIHRRLIDDALDGRPAFLWLADLHTALLSTEGLRRAGITGRERFTDAEVVCDADGPTGELHEITAALYAYERVPVQSPQHIQDALAAHFRLLTTFGVTGLHILDDWPGTRTHIAALADAGRLPVRTRIAPWFFPDNASGLADALRAMPKGGDRWEIAAVKLFLDGAIDGGGAWLTHHDCFGANAAPGWRDLPAFAAAVADVVAIGLPAWVHAIGDQAVAHTLDTFAAAGPPARGRHRIEHLEVSRPQDAARFGELGVIASMQPTHMDWSMPDHSDNWSVRVGPDRVGRAWCYRDVLDHGGTVALGTDWPIVSPDPRTGMAVAQLRRPIGQVGRPAYNLDQRMTAWEGLYGLTVAPALSTGTDSTEGRIQPGYRADLAVWAADPLVVAPDELPDVPIIATLVDGEPV